MRHGPAGLQANTPVLAAERQKALDCRVKRERRDLCSATSSLDASQQIEAYARPKRAGAQADRGERGTARFGTSSECPLSTTSECREKPGAFDDACGCATIRGRLRVMQQSL